MKQATIILICLGFIATIYWLGEKGRYQEQGGRIIDTKTGQIYTYNQTGKMIPLDYEEPKKTPNRIRTVNRLAVWPFLAYYE